MFGNLHQTCNKMSCLNSSARSTGPESTLLIRTMLSSRNNGAKLYISLAIWSVKWNWYHQVWLENLPGRKPFSPNLTESSFISVLRHITISGWSPEVLGLHLKATLYRKFVSWNTCITPWSMGYTDTREGAAASDSCPCSVSGLMDSLREVVDGLIHFLRNLLLFSLYTVRRVGFS